MLYVYEHINLWGIKIAEIAISERRECLGLHNYPQHQQFECSPRGQRGPPWCHELHCAMTRLSNTIWFNDNDEGAMGDLVHFRLKLALSWICQLCLKHWWSPCSLFYTFGCQDFWTFVSPMAFFIGCSGHNGGCQHITMRPGTSDSYL